jgi:hypothetical protein
MRKVLIIALGLASLGAIASVQQASAAAGQICKPVCDQWAPDNLGKPRCFSAHTECKNAKSVGASGGSKIIQQKKNVRQL